jgi:hypothetical protein
MRPRSLAEVAALAARGDSFDRCLANFLDEFYAAPAPAALAEEPLLLAASRGEQGSVEDAYLAATAEELARRYDLPYPTWADGPQRALHRPYFATPMASVRAALILESPAGFRARNLFVSANALSRA